MVKHWESTFSKSTRLNENVFHMKPEWDEQKVKINKWSRSLDQDGPSYYKMLKTLKKLLQNFLANCLETWYVA